MPVEDSFLLMYKSKRELEILKTEQEKLEKEYKINPKDDVRLCIAILKAKQNPMRVPGFSSDGISYILPKSTYEMSRVR